MFFFDKGLTMDKIVVNFSKKTNEQNDSSGRKTKVYGESPRGLSFVALSRVRRLQDLIINHANFDSDRLLSIKLPPHILEFDKLTSIKVQATKEKLASWTHNVV